SAGLSERHRAIQELLAGGFDRIEAACRATSEAARGPRECTLRWLALARLLAPEVEKHLRTAVSTSVILQPCLRDARPEHFLFVGERLSGLIDFGAMGVETISADLARLIGEWLGGDTELRRDAIAAYERVRPLAETESGLIEVFEASAAILI